jgi:hypothetical protein
MKKLACRALCVLGLSLWFIVPVTIASTVYPLLGWLPETAAIYIMIALSVAAMLGIGTLLNSLHQRLSR